VNLFAKPRLRADAIEIAHQQHPDHQLGIDRRAADPALERGELWPNALKTEMTVDPAQRMIGGNVVVEPEPVEELRLRRLPSHHRAILPISFSTESRI
jgi:hypothetical protein